MKHLIATALFALTLVTGSALAMTDQVEHSRYDSHSVEGDSALWGVGG